MSRTNQSCANLNMNDQKVDQEILKLFSGTVWWKESELAMTEVRRADSVGPKTAPGVIWEDLDYAATQDDPAADPIQDPVPAPAPAPRRRNAVRRRERAVSAPVPAPKRLSALLANYMPGKRESTYIDVLQTASQRDFQAPPRHEVSEYQRKSLPPTPPGLPTEMMEMRDRIVSSTQRKPVSGAAKDCIANATATDERETLASNDNDDENFYMKSRFVKDFDDEPKPLTKASTWAMRSRRRDQGNHVWLDLIRKQEAVQDLRRSDKVST